MRIKKPSACSLLAAALLLGATFLSFGGLCLRDVIALRQDIIQVLTAKLNAKMAAIETKIVGGGGVAPCQRWAYLTTQSERLEQAAAELEASMARAQQTAGTVTIGEQTFQAQLDVLGHDLVLNSTTTPLEQAGEGVGRLASYPALQGQDALLGQILRGNNSVFTGDFFKDKTFTQAEHLRDWKTVLAANPNLKIADDFLADMANSPSAGLAANVRVAATKSNVRAIDPDRMKTLYPNMVEVDILTDTEMTQVGLRSSTVQAKFGNPWQDELGNYPEIETYARGVVIPNMDNYPGKKYNWAFTEGSPADLQTRIDALNHEVARFWTEQGRSGAAYTFSLADVEVVPWQ